MASLLIACGLLPLVACSDGGDADGSDVVPVAARVDVSLPDSLEYGATLRPVVTVYDAAGAPIGGATHRLASSAPSVLVVRADGRIEAVGVGTAELTATSGVARGSAGVRVAPRVVRLESLEREVPAYSGLTVVLPAGLPTPDTAIPAELGDADSVMVVPVGGDTLQALIPAVGRGTHTLEFELDPNRVVHIDFTTTGTLGSDSAGVRWVDASLTRDSAPVDRASAGMAQ